jgi:hypothetical protein
MTSKKENPGQFADCRGTSKTNYHSKNNSLLASIQGLPIPLLAKGLYEKGLEPIPIAPGEKFPTIKDWTNISLPIHPFPKDHGIGLRTGKLSAIDIDVYDQDINQFLIDSLNFPHLTRVGQPPKVLIPVLCPEIDKKIMSDAYVDTQGEMHRIEVLSYGQQFVAYGIHPGTKQPYKWSGDLLTHSLPTVSKDFILFLFDLFYDLACKKGWRNISTREKKAEKRINVRQSSHTGDAPGSIYNRAVSVYVLLEHYGWKHYRGNYWTRPGKKTGVSASVFDDRILWPFTSNTILEPERPYDAFELLTQYEFKGDKSACARALKEAA